MIAAFGVFNSNTVLIIVALLGLVGVFCTAYFGYLSVLRQTTAVHNEIRSPNGKLTGQAVAEMRADLRDVKDDVHDVKDEQRRVRAELRDLKALAARGDP
jgi:hypothetical protein